MAQRSKEDEKLALVEANRKMGERDRRAKQEDETRKERRLNRIGVLLEEDFEEIIGSNWRNEKPHTVDLSAEKFKLETLTGHEPFRGLMNAELHRQRITYIDFSDNRLRDISILTEGNGFISLNVMIGRRNMISSPNLVLPKLVELNLAHNEMKILPVLSGMPLLEVLIISHNQLEGSFDKLQHNRRLRRIDLAFNNYRVTPGQLTLCLEALGQLPNLTTLRLMENPFVAIMKEYQIFVLKKLKDLQKLDDIPITQNIRSELDNYDQLHSLDTYNDIFDDRQVALENKEQEAKMNKKDGPQMSSFPQFVSMVNLLDEVLDDASTLLKNIEEFRTLAGFVVELFAQVLGPADGAAPEESEGDSRVEEDYWNGYNERFKSPELAIAHFLELVLNCMERHDTVRMQLVESLGCLACMHRHKFGLKCMETLGKMMQSSELSKEEVVTTLDGVIIPALHGFTKQSMHTLHCKALIEGLVGLMNSKDLTEEVAKTVSPLMHKLISFFMEAGAQEARYCIRLLAAACDLEENVKILQEKADEKFVDRVIMTLENPTIAEDLAQRELWLDTLKLAQNLAQYGSEKICATLEQASLHVRLIAKLKSIRTQGLHMEANSSGDKNAKTLEHCLQFLSMLMGRNPIILKECCTGYHLVKELTELAKEHKCKALILCRAIETITMVLRDPEMGKLYIAFVVKELSKLKLCLQYLGQSLYDGLFDEGAKQPLHNLEINHVANVVLVTMLKIIQYFADEGDVEDEDVRESKEKVNQYLNDEGREKLVLDLLIVPNEEVKLAVLECIGKVPVHQIELDEMGLLVKFLCDSKNIGAGNMEKILATAIGQLERLADGELETHEIFRKSKADEALSKTYDILLQNSARATFGHEAEENEKRNLSVACVSFFAACSKYPALQEFLRSAHINNTLFKILKYEEELHTPTGPCVAIEQTWCGRSIENLMRCLEPAKETLVRSKKVAFRLMARIADVLEGRTDGLRESTKGYTLKEICEREVVMWDGTVSSKYNRQLNDPESVDRVTEATKFVQGDGVSRIINFLSHAKTIEREAVYQKQIEEASIAKGRIQGLGKVQQIALEDDEREAKDKDEEDPVDLQGDDDPYETASGLRALMRAAQSCEDTVDEDDDAIFVTPPVNFEIHEFDENGEAKFDDNGSMGMAYITCAAFRVIYGLLQLGPSVYCKETTVQNLRDPKMVKRLMTLVEGESYLSCNLGAKFLHMMILSLEPGVFGSSDPGSRLEICQLLSNFIAKISAGMVKLLRLTKDKRLDLHQQTLCVEVARLLGMITRIVPFFKESLYGERQEVQNACITKTLDWLIPRDGLRLSIAMILYELQLDAGAGIGKDISKEYMLEAYRKREMKERATHFLSHYMVLCPEKKYDILEVFNVAEVFQRMQVRPSYLRDLLNEANTGSFMHYVESLVPEWSTHDNERVVQMAVCKSLDFQNNPITSIIALGVHEVWMLQPSTDTPPYKNTQAGIDWDPSWELEFPRDPQIIWQRSFQEVVSVFRLWNSQMLGIEWAEEDASPAGSLFADLKAKTMGKKKTDNCTVLLFERSRDRDRLSHALGRHGSKKKKDVSSYEAMHSKKKAKKIMNDTAVQVPVMKEVKKDTILMASCAMNLADKVPRMFVLTDNKVIEFTIDMDAWASPDDDHATEEDLDFRPQDVMNMVQITPGGDKPAIAKQGPKPKKVELGEAQVFTQKDEFKLPPKEITFDDTSEQPDLHFKFSGGELTIRFYDDTGREDWRRALAYYLAMGAEKTGQTWCRNG